MPIEINSLHEQVDLIKEAMKKAGVWTKESPEWVRNYQEGQIVNIWQWLQFIHLPIREAGNLQKPYYLAPQLSQYMNEDPAKTQILQLVIELDSITSTLHKT